MRYATNTYNWQFFVSFPSWNYTRFRVRARDRWSLFSFPFFLCFQFFLSLALHVYFTLTRWRNVVHNGKHIHGFSGSDSLSFAILFYLVRYFRKFSKWNAIRCDSNCCNNCEFGRFMSARAIWLQLIYTWSTFWQRSLLVVAVLKAIIFPGHFSNNAHFWMIYSKNHSRSKSKILEFKENTHGMELVANENVVHRNENTSQPENYSKMNGLIYSSSRIQVWTVCCVWVVVADEENGHAFDSIEERSRCCWLHVARRTSHILHMPAQRWKLK